MPPKSDPQRDNVYWLEAEINGWWDYTAPSRAGLNLLTTKICGYYKLDPPQIVFSNLKTADCAGDYLHGVITLYSKHTGQNPGVLLHELAHYIVDCVYEDIEDHGPEFCAIYMHMLDKFRILPHEEFRRLAKKYKVRIGRRYRPVAFR